MINWGETGIGLVYFAGLLSAILLAIAVILFILPANKPVKKIVGKSGLSWTRTFITTIMLTVMLGAMSVSFRDCHGNYDKLLNSRKETLMKGLQQISAAMQYLAWVLLFWAIIFCILYILRKNRNQFNA